MFDIALGGVTITILGGAIGFAAAGPLGATGGLLLGGTAATIGGWRWVKC